MSEVLCASGLAKSYDDGRRILKVFDHVDLLLNRGDRVSIFGRSGSGKSTLLYLLAGLLDADAGSISICGEDLGGAKSAQRADIRNRHMGFVYQFHHLLPEFSAAENVAMPLLLRRDHRSTALERAGDMLKQMGLGDRRDHLPNQLSGGEKLRVAVSRAMVTEPAIVLADEPTGNLDQRNAAQVLELMQRASEDTGSVFVVATHDQEVRHYMPHTCVLDDGTLKSLD